MKYQLKDFDYHLPSQLIAQQPMKPRDHSRLLLLNKDGDKLEHKSFFNIIDYLQKGDVLVINNSKVFPARLIGNKRETGGKIEVFLHRQIEDGLWECLLGGKVREGLMIEFTKGLEAEVIKNNEDGTWQVKVNYLGKKFWSIIEKIGQTPLPPYIKREEKERSDRKNYQTVFAEDSKIGSVAAPTAGLHFTKSLLKKIKIKGVKIVEVTLHVGLGTFAPVKIENIKQHKMHREFVEVGKKSLEMLKEAKQNKHRIVAVGTTSCRILESIDLSKNGAQAFWTDIFIFPGYRFKMVDALITNFHLPKSTLLMLISALAGKDRVDRAYQEAIRQKYRFFSYGDAMFIY